MYSWVTVTIATTMLDNAGSLMEDSCWRCDEAFQGVRFRTASRCWNRWGALELTEVPGHRVKLWAEGHLAGT